MRREDNVRPSTITRGARLYHHRGATCHQVGFRCGPCDKGPIPYLIESPFRDPNQSLREHDSLDHCRMVATPVVGPDVELRQCVCQLGHFEQVFLGVDRTLQNPDRQCDLVPLRTGERGNHVQEPSSRLLIAHHPLKGADVSPDVADAGQVRYPSHVVAERLRDVDLQPDAKSEPLLGVRSITAMIAPSPSKRPAK
jgi:hypothetical protein